MTERLFLLGSFNAGVMKETLARRPGLSMLGLRLIERTVAGPVGSLLLDGPPADELATSWRTRPGVGSGAGGGGWVWAQVVWW